jgi:hypothetical protein
MRSQQSFVQRILCRTAAAQLRCGAVDHAPIALHAHAARVHVDLDDRPGLEVAHALEQGRLAQAVAAVEEADHAVFGEHRRALERREYGFRLGAEVNAAVHRRVIERQRAEPVACDPHDPAPRIRHEQRVRAVELGEIELIAQLRIEQCGRRHAPGGRRRREGAAADHDGDVRFTVHGPVATRAIPVPPYLAALDSRRNRDARGAVLREMAQSREAAE